MWRCSSLDFVFFTKWFRVISMLHFAYNIHIVLWQQTKQLTRGNIEHIHPKTSIVFANLTYHVLICSLILEVQLGLIICTPFLCREIWIMLYSVWWLIDINEIMSFQKSTFSSVLNYFMTFQYIFLVYVEKFGKAAF